MLRARSTLRGPSVTKTFATRPRFHTFLSLLKIGRDNTITLDAFIRLIYFIYFQDFDRRILVFYYQRV